MTLTTSRTPEVPTVSVVMAVYNAAPFLREAIDSIIAQTLTSWDSSPSMTALPMNRRAFSGATQTRAFTSSHIETIAVPPYRGTTRCKRRVALTSPSWMPMTSHRRIDWHDRRSTYSHMTESGLSAAASTTTSTSTARFFTSHLPEDNDAIQATLVERWCFLHPSIMFRRALCDRVEGYRTQFEPAEDHDFILRLLEHCATHNIPERLVSYRLNPKGLWLLGTATSTSWVQSR